jgi:hypothetical protein
MYIVCIPWVLVEWDGGGGIVYCVLCFAFAARCLLGVRV